MIRSVTYGLGNALKFAAKFRSAINALITVAQTTSWLWPYVHAYLQGPKTLEELQADAKSPAMGYDIHHIVEQSAEKDGIPPVAHRLPTQPRKNPYDQTLGTERLVRYSE